MQTLRGKESAHTERADKRPSTGREKEKVTMSHAHHTHTAVVGISQCPEDPLAGRSLDSGHWDGIGDLPPSRLFPVP